MNRRRLFTALALVSAGMLVNAAPAGAATKITCGQVITVNTTLANDLHDCHTNGLVIGADNVTLDLNGHTIDGDGRSDTDGVEAFGHDGVTVRNGVVQQFAVGVALLKGSRLSATDLTLTNHRHVGVFADTVHGLTVQRVNASSIAFPGIFATRSSDAQITGNTVRRSGGGIVVSATTRAAVTGNQLTRIGCIGIEVFGATTYSLFDGNTVTGGGCEALVLADGSSNNAVTRNTFTGNDGGIGLLEADDNVLSGNVIRHNHFSGTYVAGASGNRLDGNVLADNGEGSEGGIHVGPDGSTLARGNSLTRNTITGSIGDGILVDAGSPSTMLDRNISNDNSDDGIDVDEPTTTLRANQASNNGDLGIEAVAGVADAGGNLATGNGDRRQCTHVACGS
ncbi:MAG: large repetitive protein [Actinomycetota bacterium]|jgi:parallel beta-helix repeat protein